MPCQVPSRSAPASTGTVSEQHVRTLRACAAMDIYYAAGLFVSAKFRRFPVVDNGRIVGAITRFDILRAVQRHLPTLMLHPDFELEHAG